MIDQKCISVMKEKILTRKSLMARLKTQVQMGIVLDMLSGKRFPFRVESTMMQPPFCPTYPDEK